MGKERQHLDTVRRTLGELLSLTGLQKKEGQRKRKLQVPIQTLTHSGLAVGVGVDLAIVLDDGQASGDGGHHLIVAVL